ncbi:MAG TPA: DNA primase [Caldimonas sp.]|jgi:DNA primase|nr:DNA primase [Caldimonas sp.]HEX4233137.1 DNA primase [Caldimonas sp.]
MIPPTFVHELLSRVDIVEIVGRSVELKRAGSTWKGLCPFHGEKSPSFTVSPSRQTYHCFGCGVHGNAVGFLMEHHGMGFIDAVRDLAQQAGLAVPETTSQPGEREEAARMKQKQLTLGDVLGRAADGYRRQLKASDRAIAYLKGRGLSGEVAARFGLGYATDSWRGLASVFADYEDPLLEESGLIISRAEERATDGEASEPPSGKRYDRFRDRIMFPIRSVQGPVIGFGGRVLDRGEPKYLNSPETPVFSKGRELYGLFEARAAIRQRGYALVVEGYMDVVALAQAGFENAVATLGTACTAEHVQKLVRFTDSVVFSFDGDSAGRRAAGRALQASLAHAVDTRTFRFLFLPAEHDPDSFVRERGAAEFEVAVAQAVPLSRQVVSNAGEGLDLGTAEGRARLLANGRPLWSQLPDGMLKRQLLGEFASRGALPINELAAVWRVHGVGAVRGTTTSRAERPARGRGTALRRQVAQPADRIAWMLLLESGWWETLGPGDHGALCALPGWHGELFRFLDRETAEHGARPWAVLRERIAGETWAPAALAVVDAEDPAIEPIADDLSRSLEQLRAAADRRDAMRILGRI